MSGRGSGVSERRRRRRRSGGSTDEPNARAAALKLQLSLAHTCRTLSVRGPFVAWRASSRTRTFVKTSSFGFASSSFLLSAPRTRTRLPAPTSSSPALDWPPRIVSTRP